MIEILSRELVIAQATDAAERAVRTQKDAENPYQRDTEGGRLWWQTYCTQLLRFGAEKMRKQRGEA